MKPKTLKQCQHAIIGEYQYPLPHFYTCMACGRLFSKNELKNYQIINGEIIQNLYVKKNTKKL